MGNEFNSIALYDNTTKKLECQSQFNRNEGIKLMDWDPQTAMNSNECGCGFQIQSVCQPTIPACSLKQTVTNLIIISNWGVEKLPKIIEEVGLQKINTFTF